MGGINLKKKITCIILALTLMLSLCVPSFAAERTFSDIGGHWAEETILSLAERGIVCGYPDGTVRPDNTISRAEFAALTARVFGYTGVDTESPFDDLADCWAKPQIAALTAAGIICANEYDGSFAPSEFITRGEMTRILVRAIDGGKGCTDADSFAKAAMTYGVLKGYDDGTLRLENTATRAEVFAMLVRAETAKADYDAAQKKPTVTSGGGGSYTPPAPATISFTLPKTAYVGESAAVEATCTNAVSTVWALTVSGAEAALSEDFSESCVLTFSKAGEYALTGTVKNSAGKEVVCAAATTVYPVTALQLALPAVAHTDDTVAISLAGELYGMTPVWSLSRNGEAVELADYVDGNLAEGSVRFKDKGVYTLTATVTDVLGRAFSASADITVYPVGSAGFYLPEIFHTDDTVTVEAIFYEIGEKAAAWTLTRDGTPVALENALSNSGGQLTVSESGEYVLTASFTDDGGRKYSFEQSFKVYPVPTVSFELPERIHTDTVTEMKVDSTDLDDLSVEWLVDNTFGYQDWNTFVDGTLTNDGGSIRFKRAGVYEIVARVTDDTGRVFLYEVGSKCEVLPVLDIDFSLPAVAYPDAIIDLWTTGNNNTLSVTWSGTKDGAPVTLTSAIDGALNALGGKIRFTAPGEYVLTAIMTDALVRSFVHSESITILPIVEYSVTMPESIHYGTPFSVSATSENLGGSSVVWTLTKDGEPVDFSGALTENGGEITISELGAFVLTATITDANGRVSTDSRSITVTNTAPTVTVTATPTRTTSGDGKFLVDISAVASDADGDATEIEYDGTSADGYYEVGSHTIRTRAKDVTGAYGEWVSTTFSVSNAAPTVAVSVSPTRTVSNGKFYVTTSVTASDADGDATTIEYDGFASDNYYSAGTYTVRARAKDASGAYGEWISKTFTISNSAPTTPVITRTPTGNCVTPGTAVSINATSTDPDGDAITYVWENRPSASYVYGLGRQVVRVKAVDATGAESPWAAIIFFVASSSNGGGMTLTGPESTILESGIENATITSFTFTVPPVSGHNGSDYGRVRGYNRNTGTWDQLAYQTTTNGVTLTNTMTAGVYTQLEFYYYTNHNCMYNKSNITYSVEFYFE